METNVKVRNICFAVIILICILILSYGIYHQIFGNTEHIVNEVQTPVLPTQDIEFDELFDNKINLQNYNNANFINKIEPTKEVVYTTYTLNEVYDGKYEIHASIPLININNEKVVNIDKEIVSIFYNKINNIMDGAKEEGAQKSVYTVSYTAYLNENILSLVIKATLKEGDNAQRVIIKAYTYNISTNQEVKLEEMLEIKGISKQTAETQIITTIEEAINYAQSLSSLGFESYKRNIKNEIYKIENSDNYFLGPNNSIYIIYAYGNTNFTTESDVVYIK